MKPFVLKLIKLFYYSISIEEEYMGDIKIEIIQNDSIKRYKDVLINSISSILYILIEKFYENNIFQGIQ
jgi:hypothetical protein